MDDLQHCEFDSICKHELICFCRDFKENQECQHAHVVALAMKQDGGHIVIEPRPEKKQKDKHQKPDIKNQAQDALKKKVDDRRDFFHYAQTVVNAAKYCDDPGTSDKVDQFFEEHLGSIKKLAHDLPTKLDQKKDTISRTYIIRNDEYKKRGPKKKRIVQWKLEKDPFEDILEMVAKNKDVTDHVWVSGLKSFSVTV